MQSFPLCCGNKNLCLKCFNVLSLSNCKAQASVFSNFIKIQLGKQKSLSARINFQFTQLNYCKYLCHLPARLCAFFACRRAFFTMLMVMFAAFCVAIIAQLRTDKANFFCLAAAQTHQLCCCVTNGCAFHTQLNASGHHVHIFFLRISAGTMVTQCGTFQTGINAFFVIVVIFHIKGFNDYIN